MTRRTFSYTLKPLSRISAGRAPEVVNNRAIHEVIPGTVVRGALGAAWWGGPRRGGFLGDTAGVFDRAFGAAMRVGEAVPARGSDVAVLRTATQVRCKYPASETARAPGTPSCDEWFETAALAEPPRSCRCGGALERGKGWVLGTTNALHPWVAATTRTELAGGRAVDERLFTRKALESDLLLSGEIVLEVADEVTDEVTGGRLILTAAQADEVATWLLRERRMSLGGQRSTLGRCQWTCTEQSPQVEPGLDPIGYAVQLTAPALLLDDWGSSTLDLKAGVAALIAQVGGAGEVTRARVRPIAVTGWHGMAGLPKPEEWGVAAGSVAVVRGADAATVQALRDGVGIRRTEGYGRVRVVGLSTLPGGVSGDAEAPATQTHGTVSSPVTPVLATPETPVLATPPPDAPTDPVQAILDWIPDEDRPKTVRGVLAQARVIATRRRMGATDAVILPYVQGLTSLPWMRDLGGHTQGDVIALWMRADLADHITALESLREGLA